MSSFTVTPPSEPGPAMLSADPQYVETVIRPKKGWIGVDWAELVSHRELLYFLVWRDVKVKYKQAIFGPVWAVVVPLAQVTIYTLIGVLMGLASRKMDNAPYTVYIYAGLLPWLFINTAIGGGGMSLVSNQQLLSKIYMPRLFIPTAVIGSAIVDMFLSMIVFIGLCAFFMYKTRHAVDPFMLTWHIVFLPPLFLLLVTSALGTTYILSALTVMFRDLKFIIPFITQLGIWLTAVSYPQTIFMVFKLDPITHEKVLDAAGQAIVLHDYRPWLMLNPFAGIVQSFRWAIVGEPLQVDQLLASIAWAILLLIGGLFYFKRVERRFADIA